MLFITISNGLITLSLFGHQLILSIVRFWLWSLVTLVCFVIMFFMSFTLHGVLLTDFLKTYTYFSSLEESKFYLIVGTMYFIMAVILAVIYKLFLKLSKHPISHGGLLGVSLGIFVFLILQLSGLPLFQSKELEHVAFNLFWQLLEQGIGGMVIGYIYKILNDHQTKKYGLLQIKRKTSHSDF